jgi:hypothetical protein
MLRSLGILNEDHDVWLDGAIPMKKANLVVNEIVMQQK